MARKSQSVETAKRPARKPRAKKAPALTTFHGPGPVIGQEHVEQAAVLADTAPAGTPVVDEPPAEHFESQYELPAPPVRTLRGALLSGVALAGFLVGVILSIVTR